MACSVLLGTNSTTLSFFMCALSPEAKKLQYALEKVAATHQLAREINMRAHTKYDSTNHAHEKQLMLLWDLLCPQEKLTERYSKQWTEIGFQGKDPATDFRGMGMLGLDDLVYYAKYYPKSSKHALECSHDKISWYSFAIVGINITQFAVQTLRTRQLQYYLFLNGTDRSVYHELYCFLFHRFNQYWTSIEPKPCVMEFERHFADFKVIMERQLGRRKLMTLRNDTTEDLDSRGHPIVQPNRRQPPPPHHEKNGIELDTRKTL
ncbi:ELMO/CED-12 family-domain-containing protein [Mortierella sp. GBAus27b]|nr:ELMO/CED-12 family-domain-containing protein [Mortierella sp. GBAus27b]